MNPSLLQHSRRVTLKKSAPLGLAVPTATEMRERRILILAPTHNDARLTAEFLTAAGLSAQICRGLPELVKRTGQGCAAILLAEETLRESVSLLAETLSNQPSWSDIPVTIITSGGEVGQMRLRRLAFMGPGGNVSFLERPFRPATLVSAMKVALRARERQYEIRDSMQALRESEARYGQLVHSLPTAVYTTDARGRSAVKETVLSLLDVVLHRALARRGVAPD